MDIGNCLHESLPAMTWLEAIAVITGIASVWYARKESILVYPVGIVSVLLYVYICLEVKLYADAAINAYYFIVSVYGWYFWLHGGRIQQGLPEVKSDELDADLELYTAKRGEEAHIARNNKVENIYFIFLTALLAIFLGFILDTYTDSNVPYWDGSTTAVFCIAMILMARKKIENWVYWIIGDIACVPLFLYKGLCMSSLQYLIFTILAVAGFLTWLKKYKQSVSAHA
ncbi:MAG: nicotinamide riboside transporter PnuC [Chitinophagales bacterium]